MIPKDDLSNIILLTVLYLLQGIPLGLTFGAIPFLLQERWSLGELGTFTLTNYPYSLKLLWSPIVDAVYSSRVGRRKSWIIPIQLCIAFAFYHVSGRVDRWIDENDNYTLTAWFFAIIFLTATQDIAVDGWALSILKPHNLHFASTCQTIGLNTGYFVSFTVFLAFTSPEFCSKFLGRTENSALLSLSGYLYFWSIVIISVTIWLTLFTREANAPEKEQRTIGDTYTTIWHILQLPQVRALLGVLLTCKLAFAAHEAATGLKLMQAGMKKEDLALAVLIDFPLEIIFGYFGAKWSRGNRPLRPWLYCYYGRLLAPLTAVLILYYIPAGSTHLGFTWFLAIVAAMISNSFMSTVQFVSQGAFFASISDPTIGGTYMTLLNTFANLGGTWPKYFVLKLIDYASISTCVVKSTDGANISGDTFPCSSDDARHRCQELLGRKCRVDRDGYYPVSITLVALGIIWLLLYIRPTVKRLENLSVNVWRLREEKKVE